MIYVYWWRYGSWNYGNTANKCKKKQASKQRCLKSCQSTSSLHPFNPPKRFLTGPTGGLQKTPSHHPPSHRRFRKAELQELNNGRLAMMGITGLIAQAVRLDDRRWVGTSRWTFKKHTKHTKTFLSGVQVFFTDEKNKKPPKTAVEEPRRFLFFWLGTN